MLKLLKPLNLLWGVLLAFSISVQTLIPTFGDEAYFIAWGHNPSFGYYDHPPTPGWISSVLISIEHYLGATENGALHRVAILLAAIVTIAILGRYFQQRFPHVNSNEITLSFFALPVPVFVFNMYFNDSILPFFLLGFFVATEASYNAREINRKAIVFAGICFGLALLTKYSAGVYYIGVVLFLVTHAKGRKFLFGRFMFISAIAGSLFLINLIWNYNNCSVNLGFNFSFRKSSFGINGLAELVVSLVFLFGPAGFWIGRAIYQKLPSKPIGTFTGILLGCLVSVTLFSVLRGQFGMHWGIPLIFLLMLSGFELFERLEVRNLALSNFMYLFVFIVPFFIIYALDGVGFKSLGSYGLLNKFGDLDIVMDVDDGSLIMELEPYATGNVVATPTYGLTSQLANNGIQETVMFSQMVYGRNSDLFVDFRNLEGRTVVYVSGNLEGELSLLARFFDSFEIVTLTGSRQDHPVFIGTGFNYEIYRELMILPVMAKFYDQSEFAFGGCYMDKYRTNLL